VNPIDDVFSNQKTIISSKISAVGAEKSCAKTCARGELLTLLGAFNYLSAFRCKIVLWCSFL
jgi:hypothetical protein